MVQPLVLLAETRTAQGDLVAARVTANEALSIAKRALGGLGHTEWMGLSLLSLAKLERASGDLPQARAVALQAAEHMRASSGESSIAHRAAAQLAK